MVGLSANDAASVAAGTPEPRAGIAAGQSGRAAVAYDAFISYSHAKDKPVATALQSVVQKLGKPWYRRRALRLFRDDTSLSATPHLWPSIEQALSQSRFLILLASPEAAASRWVGQEIAYWLDHNSADTVLIALTDGGLDWDEAASDFRWSRATPLPRVLKNRFADEPRWIDLRPYRDGSTATGREFMGLGADFAAAIRGIAKEDLLSEEVRQQRQARALAGAAMTALIALLVVAGWQWQEAQLQRNDARLQRDHARMQLLAAQARRANVEATSPDDIERAGALALESIEVAHLSHRPAEADSVETARSALIGLPLWGRADDGLLTALAVLPDERLASGDYDGKIKIWPKEGEGDPVVLSHGRKILALAVLTDGRLASGGEGGEIKLWPKDYTGEPVVLSNTFTVYALVVLPDGRLASGGYDGKIKLWPKDGVGEPMVVSHGSSVKSLAVTADGRLASGGYDGKIKLWSKDGVGEPVVLLHGSSVKSLAVLSDGRLAGGGYDGKIKIWPKEGTDAPVVLVHGSPVRALAALANGRLASVGEEGKIKLWSTNDPSGPLVLWHGYGGTYSLVSPVLLTGRYSLVVLEDGRLASGGWDGTIKIWPKDGSAEPVILPADGPVQSLAVLADGRLASGQTSSEFSRFKIWRKDGTGPPETLSIDRPIYSLAGLTDGWLASARP